MKHLILHETPLVAKYVCEAVGGVWDGTGVGIGLGDGKRIIAGVLLDSYNGASCQMHVASDGSREWMNRQMLWISFALPFMQWQVKSIIAPVAENNAASRHFCERLGFVLKATLEDAHPSGALLLYQIKRSECRWLNIKLRTRHEWWKEQRSPAA